jgi:hypothetical protein
MLKGQDIVVLLAIAGREPMTVREIADLAAFDAAGVTRSLRRLSEAGLYDKARRVVPVPQAEEFLLHGLRYVFPGRMTGESRGVPTAWAAEPLASLIADTAPLPPVWPHVHGEVRGIALVPLHGIAADAALRDAVTWRRLALADALRIGDARVRGLAGEAIGQELRTVVAA